MEFLPLTAQVQVENEDYTYVHVIFQRHHDSELQELMKITNKDIGHWIWRDVCKEHTNIGDAIHVEVFDLAIYTRFSLMQFQHDLQFKKFVSLVKCFADNV